MLANDYNSRHYSNQASIRKEWRELFYWIAKEDFTTFEYVDIEVDHYYMKGVRPDVGATFWCAKAAVDSLVDAKVLVQDDPEYVRSIKFNSPIKTDFWGIALKLTEVKP